MAGYNNDPNAVRYNQRGLLPDLVILPKDLPKQRYQAEQGIGNLATRWLASQVPIMATTYYATGKTPGGLFRAGLGKLGSLPPVANGIAALGAARFGAPLVNGLKNFSQTPVAKVAAEIPDDIAGLIWSLRNGN